MLTAGIFQKMEMYNPPWGNDNARQLDIAYTNRSANKLVTPLINHYIDDDVGTLSDSALTDLVSACYEVNKRNWEMLWKANNTNYEPLENYNRNANITDKSTQKNTGTLQNQRTGTDTGTVDKTLTDSGTITNGGTVGNDTANNTYGFDSNNAVPSSSTTQTTTNDLTETHDLNNTINETRQLANSDNSTETRNLETTNENIHSETIKGNIGVTTSQQMLQSEYDFRSNYNFFEHVFKDVDNFFTLSIY